jgi:hypothetical protein
MQTGFNCFSAVIFECNRTNSRLSMRKTFGSIEQDCNSDMAIDKNGFIYVLGTFSDSLNLNPSDEFFAFIGN